MELSERMNANRAEKEKYVIIIIWCKPPLLHNWWTTSIIIIVDVSILNGDVMMERNRFLNAGYSVWKFCVGSLFTLIFKIEFIVTHSETVLSVIIHIYLNQNYETFSKSNLDPKTKMQTSANILNGIVEFLDWHQTKWNIFSLFLSGPFVTLNEVYWKTIECNVQRAHRVFHVQCSSNWLKWVVRVIMKSEGNSIVLHLFFFGKFLLSLLYFSPINSSSSSPKHLRSKFRNNHGCGIWLHIVVKICDTYQKLANNRKMHIAYCIHGSIRYYFDPAFIGVNCELSEWITDIFGFGFGFYFFSFDTKQTWLNIQWFFIFDWILNIFCSLKMSKKCSMFIYKQHGSYVIHVQLASRTTKKKVSFLFYFECDTHLLFSNVTR